MSRRADGEACAEFAEALPEALDAPGVVSPLVTAHVESCLTCQAELARYRKLLRMLGQLRQDRIELAPGVLAEVLDSLGTAARRRAVRSALTGHPVAYGGGLAAACLAAAGLLVLGRLRGTRQPAGT